MLRLEVSLLKHTDRRELDRYLHLYSRCFNPAERVSPRILRWVIEPSPARVNPVHLFAAYLVGSAGFATRDSRLGTSESKMANHEARSISPESRIPSHESRMVGGACTLVLPAFQVVFGSYIFVDPALRRRGLGLRILRQVLRQERRGAHGWNWRMYGEVTASSGNWWHRLLASAGFRFFPTPWPLGSYEDPARTIPGRLCYFPYRVRPPARFSQPALLAYIHALFYSPEAMHRHLLPRLKNFIRLDA